MALKKISELSLGTPLETDVIPYVDLVAGETKKALKSELKGVKGDKGDTGSQGIQGIQGIQGVQGVKGDKGDTGTAATATAGTTTTGNAGTNASVVNSGSTSAAVFDFTIPRGDTGAAGPAGPTGIDWQGAWSAGTYTVRQSVSHNGSSWIATTTTTEEPSISATDWDLIALKGTDGAGSGDVSGPASSTADAIVLFNSTTGKLIKDSVKTIVATLGTDDATVPTSKAVKDVTDGLVTKALYDAQTVLHATSDNTPVALTVGEQTVVGRATGGNIAALSIDSDLSSVSANDDTIPSAKATKAALDAKAPLASPTFTGTVTLPTVQLGEASMLLDAALSADGKWSGITETGTAGAALAFGELCYFQASDSRWELVDANLSAGYDKKLGMCVLAAAGDGSATEMLLIGKIRADAKFPTMTIGSPVYMSETAGAVTSTQPSTADVAIRVVGYANTADELYFNPSPDYIVHV